DLPHPLSTYGKSKLWGEYFTIHCNPNHLVLRTSWLYGKVGRNFVKTVVHLAQRGEDLRIVDDQRGSPTFVGDIVAQTWILLEKDRVGCYHSANQGETTWYRLAQKVFTELKLQAQVIPIATKEYRTLAKRPKYSVLQNFLLEMEGLNIMRLWDEALKDFLQNFKGEFVDG
ncbi:MAG: SDR family oxidoreductase, partial [Candidatus Caldatribacteriaceae bacterium]